MSVISLINKAPKRSSTKPKKKIHSSESLKEILNDKSELTEKKKIKGEDDNKTFKLKMNNFMDGSLKPIKMSKSKNKPNLE